MLIGSCKTWRGIVNMILIITYIILSNRILLIVYNLVSFCTTNMYICIGYILFINKLL